METRQRLVPLVGAFNFRDLGGYPVGDGTITRWGVLYRSDALQHLTDADITLLRGLGIATIIDLRTKKELDQTGRGIIESEPIEFRHHSVLREPSGESLGAPRVSDRRGPQMGERYLSYLDKGVGPLTTALTLLGDPDRLPVVFNCAAGKDRTGVLAALVLELLGVEDEQIVADYLMTTEAMPKLIDRFSGDPNVAARIEKLGPTAFELHAETMHTFLGGLRGIYGGTRGWALGAGVPEEVLDRMKKLLTQPA